MEFAFGEPSALLGGSSGLLEEPSKAEDTALGHQGEHTALLEGETKTPREGLQRLIQDEAMMDFGGKHASDHLLGCLDTRNASL